MFSSSCLLHSSDLTRTTLQIQECIFKRILDHDIALTLFHKEDRDAKCEWIVTVRAL